MPPLDSLAGVAVGIVAILVGVANCFFGYRIFGILLAVTGFILGAVLAGAAAASITDGDLPWIIVGALVGGIVGSGLLAGLYVLGVFAIGALAGGLLGMGLAAAVGLGDAGTVIAIILAIVGGVLALVLQRAIIIISTALSGAWGIAWGLYIVFGGSLGAGGMMQRSGQAGLGASPVIVLVLWFLFAVAGIVIQFAVTAREKPAPQTAPAPFVAVPPVAPPPIAAAQVGPPAPGAYCPNCGQPLAHGVRFCGGCGSEVASLWS